MALWQYEIDAYEQFIREGLRVQERLLPDEKYREDAIAALRSSLLKQIRARGMPLLYNPDFTYLGDAEKNPMGRLWWRAKDDADAPVVGLRIGVTAVPEMGHQHRGTLTDSSLRALLRQLRPMDADDDERFNHVVDAMMADGRDPRAWTAGASAFFPHGVRNCRSALRLGLWSIDPLAQRGGLARLVLSHLKYLVVIVPEHMGLYISHCYLPTRLAVETSWAVETVPLDAAIVAPGHSVFTLHAPYIGSPNPVDSTDMAWTRPALRAYQRALQARGITYVATPQDADHFYFLVLRAIERQIVMSTGILDAIDARVHAADAPASWPLNISNLDELGNYGGHVDTISLASLKWARSGPDARLPPPASPKLDMALYHFLFAQAAYHEALPAPHFYRLIVHVVFAPLAANRRVDPVQRAIFVAFLVDVVRDFGHLLCLEGLPEDVVDPVADWPWPTHRTGMGPAPTFVRRGRSLWYCPQAKPSVFVPRLADFHLSEADAPGAFVRTIVPPVTEESLRATMIPVPARETVPVLLTHLLNGSTGAAAPLQHACSLCARPAPTLITPNGYHAFCDPHCYDDFYA